MNKHEVVIAGGGPTGLMLAAELKLAGVDAVIVERRPDQQLAGSRAGGLHARTLEILDQRGVVDRFIAAGQTFPNVGYAQIQLPIADFPTRHNYVLALWQNEVERLLAEWVEELGVELLRSNEVTGFAQDDEGVDVALASGGVLRAGYLVGCDGGRSAVRKAAGIDFEGIPAASSFMLAEVEMRDQPVIGMRPEGGGIGPVNIGSAGGPYRVVLREPEAEHDGDPSLDDLRALLQLLFGTDFGVHSPTWISRFSDMTRQAVSYRSGRVLLAGDAAHVHPPHGGQGLNTGVQDAFNLGWKLAQVVTGLSPATLLDSYHAERHPVGARVLHNTRAQVALSGVDERHQSLRETMMELLAMDEPRKRIAGMISGLDIAYDLGAAHPLVGRRMPDLDIQIDGVPTRVCDLLHDARPVLLAFREGAWAATGWHERVGRVRASYRGRWVLPVIGEVEAPAAVLIRPDGHVAWVGEPGDPSLAETMERWFGPAD